MLQSTAPDSAYAVVEATSEIKYGFDCVLDAPSLVAVLQNQDKECTLLEQWLRAASVKVHIPQDVLNSLKNQRTEAAQKTLMGLDRVTNHFSNVRFEQSFDSYQTLEDLLHAPKPMIHWHDFVAKRSVGNDEIAALSASLGNAMHINSGDSDNTRRATLQEGQLGDSAPISEQPAAKVLAPIGTGRPGKTKSAESSPPVHNSVMDNTASAHPVFRYMWFKMNEQADDGIKHIWLLVSSNPLLENGAKELGVPCMSHQSLDKVFSAEFQDTTKRTSRSYQTANGGIGLSFPLTPPFAFVPQYQRRHDSMPSNNGKTTPVPSDQPIDQHHRLSIDHTKGNVHAIQLNNTIPTGPRSMRVNVMDQNDRQAVQNGVMLVDPNSFNRSHLKDNNARPGRQGRSDFTLGHRHRNSGHEPPPNAPTGPRSMSGSSEKSRPNIKLLSPNASPVLKSSITMEQQAAVSSLTNSPRLENSHFHRAASADLGPIQRPASRGAITSAQPGSPRVINGSPQSTANSRVQRAPRHVPYVPPKAREQMVQQASKNTLPMTTTPPGNIDLTKPIDPDSFGRGQVAPGTTKSQPVPHHHNTSNKRGNATRGGSMRGRGHRGSMRGRGTANGDRKLYDPS